MKQVLMTICMVCVALFSKAQSADDIVGSWKNGEGTGIVQVYKTTSGHYAGKIVWLKEPIDPETKKAKLDKRNPNATLRTVPTLGLINLKGFLFNAADKVWDNGTIYDPKVGKEYSCKANLTGPNTLEVRGFIGVSLFGRTDTWTRMVKK
jgi:uncharacterized protein (DUF2147 family)